MPKKFGVQTNPCLCIFVYILQTFYINRLFAYYVIKEGEGVLAYSWGSKKGGSKKDKYVIT